MDIENVNKTLKEINFDEKEIEIYLALLKIGETTATKISQETHIERTLVYYITEKLINRGMVSFKLKNNVKYYSASDPSKILEEIREKEKSFLNILPFLEQIRKKIYENEAKVDIYKGEEGLKAIINDMFKSNEKEFLILGEEGQLQSNYPIIYSQYLKRLEKEKKKEKVLIREDFRKKIGKSKNSQFRYLSKEIISPVAIVIYEDKIQMIIWDKPTFNILIKSKKISDSFRSYFNYFWKIAKK